jgi:hypothetical protein
MVTRYAQRVMEAADCARHSRGGLARRATGCDVAEAGALTIVAPNP